MLNRLRYREKHLVHKYEKIFQESNWVYAGSVQSGLNIRVKWARKHHWGKRVKSWGEDCGSGKQTSIRPLRQYVNTRRCTLQSFRLVAGTTVPEDNGCVDGSSRQNQKVLSHNNNFTPGLRSLSRKLVHSHRRSQANKFSAGVVLSTHRFLRSSALKQTWDFGLGVRAPGSLYQGSFCAWIWAQRLEDTTGGHSLT